MLRTALIILLILIVLGHFGGVVPFMYGGPVGFVVLLLLICVLAGVV